MRNDYTPHGVSFGRPAARMTRQRALGVLGIAGAAAVVCVLFLDEPLMRLLGPYHGGLGSKLKGDVRRELEFLQQYGGAMSLVLIAITIALLDRRTVRRFPAFLAAIVVNFLVYQAMKFGLGRPRPRVMYSEDALASRIDVTPRDFGYFWRSMTLPRDGDPVLDGFQPSVIEAKSWELGKGISSDLWSMPSSHTAAAFLASAVLTRMYPALTPLLVPLACVVGVGRVLTGAHFVSDVLVGGAIGWVVGRVVYEAVR